METELLEKYLIKKDENTDMLSSLKKVDEIILKSAMEEWDCTTIEEFAEYIINDFEDIVDVSQFDIFSLLFFERLLENENSIIFTPTETDVTSFWVFVYDNGDNYSYYIPNEIKNIIRNFLDKK